MQATEIFKHNGKLHLNNIYRNIRNLRNIILIGISWRN